MPGTCQRGYSVCPASGLTLLTMNRASLEDLLMKCARRMLQGCR